MRPQPARAGLRSLIYSDDASAKTQVVSDIGVVTPAISTNVLSVTVTETADTVGDSSTSDLGGSSGAHFEYMLDAEGEFTPWIYGSSVSVTVSGTWVGTIVATDPNGVTYPLVITSNGVYTFTGGVGQFNLRMTGYVSGTAVITSS